MTELETYKIGKLDFIEMKYEEIEILFKAKLDKCFTTQESIDAIEKAYCISERTTKELRAIRNTIVKEFGIIMKADRALKDYKHYDIINVATSTYTALIDTELFKREAL